MLAYVVKLPLHTLPVLNRNNVSVAVVAYEPSFIPIVFAVLVNELEIVNVLYVIAVKFPSAF
jgi:hypothetical protein